MKKRIISSLLVICMLCALLPATAFADTTKVLDEAVITITAPQAGKTPSTKATVPSDADYYVKSVKWSGALNNGKFKSGVAYTANITLGIVDGSNAIFSDTVFDAKVNGDIIDAKTLKRNSDTELVVPVQYEKLTDNVLDEAVITITAPEIGKTPSTKATVPTGVDYYVKDLTWSGSLSSGKFQSGVAYTATITLVIIGNRDTVFSDTTFDAIVNGDIIDAKTLKRNSDKEMIIPVKYERLMAESKVLDEATITITAPEVGKTPSTKATVPTGVDYTVKSVKWSGTLDNGKFKSGVEYTATITLGIKSGSNAKFSDTVFDAKVNGDIIDAKTLTRKSDTELIVPVQYEKLADTTKVVKSASITITAPEIGKKPSTKATVPSGVDYYVKKMDWRGTLDSDGKFQSGVEYTATITLGINSGTKAKFSDTASFTAKVNGVELDEKTFKRNSDTELVIPVEYEKLTAAVDDTAYDSTQTVDIDGKKVEFQMYALKDANGNDTNYIKVRDLALALNGTKAQFNVSWDGTVNLTKNTAYAPNGSENKTPFNGKRGYTVPKEPTKVNGKASDLAAITLTDDAGGGYTYYKLRDLGSKLGFNVSWSAERGVYVETNKAYKG